VADFLVQVLSFTTLHSYLYRRRYTTDTVYIPTYTLDSLFTHLQTLITPTEVSWNLASYDGRVELITRYRSKYADNQIKTLKIALCRERFCIVLYLT
jgi:hypothetical protein